jgi:sporulation protein YlmC with PRC-barrel domain
MNASRLKGQPVVSMADGAQVGTVKELLFETADVRLTALVLRAHSGESTLPFGLIRSVGTDAVMIERTADTTGMHGQTELTTTRSLTELLGLSAVNVAGTLLGQVKEVEINEQDGRLTTLQVHRGGVLGLGGTTVTIPSAAIRGIGPKLITVDMPDEASEQHHPS